MVSSLPFETMPSTSMLVRQSAVEAWRKEDPSGKIIKSWKSLNSAMEPGRVSGSFSSFLMQSLRGICRRGGLHWVLGGSFDVRELVVSMNNVSFRYQGSGSLEILLVAAATGWLQATGLGPSTSIVSIARTTKPIKRTKKTNTRHAGPTRHQTARKLGSPGTVKKSSNSN